MKNGQCPKCNSSNIFKKENGLLMGGKTQTLAIFIGSFTQGAACDCYICADCGYFESFIVSKDTLEQVRQAWTKVS
jgi:predicted nucleic-acid-binding Zn-ribbon protein